MRFYPVHAHAVLIDSIPTMLQSIVTGTVSVQPWQDHEVSAVRCCVAQQWCSITVAQLLFFQMALAYLVHDELQSIFDYYYHCYNCCDFQGASSTLQQLWDVCKLQSQAVHADSRTAEEVACNWKHDRCLLCTPWWDYILMTAVNTLRRVRQDFNITHCVVFKFVPGDSCVPSWSQLNWFAWSAGQDQRFKWCTCCESQAPFGISFGTPAWILLQDVALGCKLSCSSTIAGQVSPFWSWHDCMPDYYVCSKRPIYAVHSDSIAVACASCPVLAGCDTLGLFYRYDIFPKSDCDQMRAASQVWHRQTSFLSLTRASLGQGCWQQGQWLLANPLGGVPSLFSKLPLTLVWQVGRWLRHASKWNSW